MASTACCRAVFRASGWACAAERQPTGETNALVPGRIDEGWNKQRLAILRRAARSRSGQPFASASQTRGRQARIERNIPN
jgi:hypothetical protein